MGVVALPHHEGVFARSKLVEYYLLASLQICPLVSDALPHPSVSLYIIGNAAPPVVYIVENGEITTTISIGNKNNDVEYEEYNTHEYININNDDKILLTDGKWGTIGGSDNVLHTENLWDLFKCAVKARIEERTFKGKNCYYVDNFESNERGNTLEGMYIDKETGLEIYSNKKNSEEYVFETVYEFNTVTEEDFIEPDASEYKTMTRNEYYTSLVEESEK